MVLLNIISGIIIHTILFSGIFLFLVSLIVGIVPGINIVAGRYKIPAQVLGLVLMCFGFWLEGAYYIKKKTDAEIQVLETKLAAAEAASVITNSNIQTQIVHDIQVIHDRGKDVIHYIQTDPVIQKSNNECVIPEEIITAHNNAVGILTSLPAPPSTGDAAKQDAATGPGAPATPVPPPPKIKGPVP